MSISIVLGLGFASMAYVICKGGSSHRHMRDVVGVGVPAAHGAPEDGAGDGRRRITYLPS
jgi:hypothetical protein